MKAAMVFFAGVMIASAAVAGQNDPLAEERYKMKYGRYTPVEEARRKAAKEQATDATEYVVQSCCRHTKHEASAEQATLNSSGTEAWFRMKYGRSTPRAEARQRVEGEQVAMHVRMCGEMGGCPLVAANKATGNTNVAGADVSATDAWFRAKFGRSAPSEEQRRAATAVKETSELLVASANAIPCEEECCKHGE